MTEMTDKETIKALIEEKRVLQTRVDTAELNLMRHDSAAAAQVKTMQTELNGNKSALAKVQNEHQKQLERQQDEIDELHAKVKELTKRANKEDKAS
jgi:hypothetical protein